MKNEEVIPERVTGGCADAGPCPRSQWRPMKSAPKDGTMIRARGREWGDPNGKWFEVETLWEDRRWTDLAREWSYRYLTDWEPLVGGEAVHSPDEREGSRDEL